MTCQKQPPTPEPHARLRSPELDAAYRRMELAYQAARREVFDLFPDGLPDSEHLTVGQREALSQLHFAERALDDLRKSQR